ncbi:hypothetical protein BJ742DRAFT_786188 [Cladochytrium replicatum]|nr:hypothetical protein BJ742DRAFT_786188 [Cladochytrium replicatum]
MALTTGNAHSQLSTPILRRSTRDPSPGRIERRVVTLPHNGTPERPGGPSGFLTLSHSAARSGLPAGTDGEPTDTNNGSEAEESVEQTAFQYYYFLDSASLISTSKGRLPVFTIPEETVAPESQLSMVLSNDDGSPRRARTHGRSASCASSRSWRKGDEEEGTLFEIPRSPSCPPTPKIGLTRRVTWSHHLTSEYKSEDWEKRIEEYRAERNSQRLAVLPGFHKLKILSKPRRTSVDSETSLPSVKTKFELPASYNVHNDSRKEKDVHKARGRRFSTTATIVPSYNLFMRLRTLSGNEMTCPTDVAPSDLKRRIRKSSHQRSSDVHAGFAHSNSAADSSTRKDSVLSVFPWWTQSIGGTTDARTSVGEKHPLASEPGVFEWLGKRWKRRGSQLWMRAR